MRSQAIEWMNAHLAAALEGAKKEEVVKWAKRARGELEAATGLGVALMIEAGVDMARAGSKMLAPDLAVMIESNSERAVKELYATMDHGQAERFNKDLGAIDQIRVESVGYLAAWVFEDGSAWIALKGHPREVAAEALADSDFAEREAVVSKLWAPWSSENDPLGELIGAKLRKAKSEGLPMVALDARELKSLGPELARAWGLGEISGWGKGMGMKLLANGTALHPLDLCKVLDKAGSRGKEVLERVGMRRADEIRKERETRMKIHWRDAICVFMVQVSVAPVYDGGLAAFLMSKPGLFGMFPLPVWRKIFSEVIDVVKPLPEGVSPEIDQIEKIAGILGGDTASQLAHFLYRYHRAGGAKLTAKRVLEQIRERMVVEATKHGLAAAVKAKEIMTDEMKESVKLASSVEFSTQYGAALALYAVLWANEEGYENISMQARAVIKTMRGAGEITMECFGWFAKLLFEFSEGFVSKEEIAASLRAEMEIASASAEVEKRQGGKITIENEWSGNWGSELSSRKVREYLGLEKSR